MFAHTHAQISLSIDLHIYLTTSILKKHSICIHLQCSKIFCINLFRNFVNLKVFSKHVYACLCVFVLLQCGVSYT